MNLSSEEKRNLCQNTLAAMTGLGLAIFWWKPFLAWLLAGFVSSGLLLEADHISSIVRSRDARVKVGIILLSVVVLILSSSWRLMNSWK